MIERSAIDGRKVTAEKHLAIGLNPHGVNRAVYTASHVESLIHSSIRIQSGKMVVICAANRCKITTDHDFPNVCTIRTNHQRPDSGVGAISGVERCIQGAVDVQSRD